MNNIENIEICNLCANFFHEKEMIINIRLVKNKKGYKKERYIHACKSCVYMFKDTRYNKITCECGKNNAPLKEECKNEDCDDNIGLVIEIKPEATLPIYDIVEKKY